MTIQSVFLAIAISVTLISEHVSAQTQTSPQTLLAGEVLKAGEIDSSKVKVGTYAEVIYGTGERDQVSGKWEKLDTAQGYVKAVDAESLTISQGLGKRIAFDRIHRTGTRSFSIAISLIGDFEKINEQKPHRGFCKAFHTMEDSTLVIFIRFLRVPPGRPNLFGDQ